MVSCSTYGKHTKSLFYCIFGIFFSLSPIHYARLLKPYSDQFFFYFLGKKTFWNCWRFVWEVISIWVLMDKSIRIWLCRQKGVSLSILRKSPIALSEKSILQYAQSNLRWENQFLQKQDLLYMDPLLVKRKCVSICLHFSAVCLWFFKKPTASQTHFGFSNIAS